MDALCFIEASTETINIQHKNRHRFFQNLIITINLGMISL